jgi:hypothetical protein
VADMRVRSTRAAALLGLAATLLAADSSAGTQAEVRWRPLVKVPGALDVVGPRADGRLVVASNRGLFLLRRGGTLTPFARGTAGYKPASGEAYIAMARARRLSSAGCRFRRDDVYALDPVTAPGVIKIDRLGRSRRFADLPAGSFLSGIAFDHVGRFGSRLLVSALVANKLTLYAVDCRGRSSVVLRDGPRIEGGMAVAPKSFGRFGGQLVAVDENSGRIYAFDRRGRVQLLAESGLAAGPDIGVESVGFVPSTFRRRGAAYMADFGAPGAPTTGTDSLLTLRGADLARAGVRAGDMLAATEAGAVTIAVRCLRRCSVRRIATGPTMTHGEGHLTVVAG